MERGAGVTEVKEPNEEWASNLRELEVIRDAMVHVTRNLLMGIIDRTVYIDLMTKYYEGIRRVLLKALEGNYPNEFFQSYTETFSDPAHKASFISHVVLREGQTHAEGGEVVLPGPPGQLGRRGAASNTDSCGRSSGAFGHS